MGDRLKFRPVLNEVGSYLLCGVGMVASYFIGNFVVAYFYEMSTAFDEWGGQFVAAAQALAGVFIYSTAMFQFSSLKARHVALPPIIASASFAQILLLSFVGSGYQMPESVGAWLYLISAIVGALIWGVFGLYRLFEAD